MRFMKNTWLDMCKRAERKNISMESVLENQGEAVFYRQSIGQADILQSMIKKEESTGIYKEIHTLKEPYKEVLLLRIMGCLSFQQIGEIFGKSETWGRVTFHRAKEKVKKQIGDE